MWEVRASFFALLDVQVRLDSLGGFSAASAGTLDDAFGFGDLKTKWSRGDESHRA